MHGFKRAQAGTQTGETRETDQRRSKTITSEKGKITYKMCINSFILTYFNNFLDGLHDARIQHLVHKQNGDRNIDSHRFFCFFHFWKPNGKNLIVVVVLILHHFFRGFYEHRFAHFALFLGLCAARDHPFFLNQYRQMYKNGNEQQQQQQQINKRNTTNTIRSSNNNKPKIYRTEKYIRWYQFLSYM